MSFAIPAELDEMPPLNGVERAALSAVCDALFPELPADQGAVPGVLEGGATALAVPERIEETMPALGASERERLRLLLRLLERPATMLLLSGRARGFSALSLVCTHLGCTVESKPEGFVCPCHGSRFDLQGKVTRGPAGNPLNSLRTGITSDGKLHAYTN